MPSPEPVAVVLAGGVGTRVGDALPKQFLDLNGASVLARTLASLSWCDRIVLVHHGAHRDRARRAVEAAGMSDRTAVTAGGETRRESIGAALAVLADVADSTRVVLQNAASPNTPRELFERCLAALDTDDMVQAYVPATQTVMSIDPGGAGLTPPGSAGALYVGEVYERSRLGHSADPTTFRMRTLRRIVAAQAASGSAGEMTMDTARALGVAVRLVRSPDANIKLTTPHDLVLLQSLVPPWPD